MYIALRWLVGLTVAMWIVLCVMDPYRARRKFPECILAIPEIEDEKRNEFKNVTEKSQQPVRDTKINPKKKEDSLFIHYIVSFVAITFVYLAPKKADIMHFTRKTRVKIDFKTSWNNLTKVIELKVRAMNLFGNLKKVLQYSWNSTKELATPNIFQTHQIAHNKTDSKLNILLIRKLKEIIEEKRSISQLLGSAMDENKNLKFQYQLETLEKNKLVRHLANVEKQSSFMNFQHLYLITHQENIFLKSRLKKTAREKHDVERNLIILINKVYCSQNSDLKAFCSRFVVNTRKNLLSSDVGEEITKFLNKTGPSSNSSSYSACASRVQKQDNFETSYPNNYVCKNTRSIVEIQDEVSPISRVETPKSTEELSESYYWTVKNNDGIVEKLYEYNYGPNYDSGGTIRSIREYSVYFDKDCLLDTSVQKIETKTYCNHSLYGMEHQHICKHKFLTGSEEFRKFMDETRFTKPKPQLKFK